MKLWATDKKEKRLKKLESDMERLTTLIEDNMKVTKELSVIISQLTMKPNTEELGVW